MRDGRSYYQGRSTYRREERERQRRSQQLWAYQGLLFKLQVVGAMCLVAFSMYVKHTDSPQAVAMRQCIARSLNVSTNIQDIQVFWQDLQQAGDLAVAVFAPETSETAENPDQDAEAEQGAVPVQDAVGEDAVWQAVPLRLVGTEPMEDYDTGEMREEQPAQADPQTQDVFSSMMAPICGTVTSTFGSRMHPIEQVEKFHYGVDVAPTDESQYEIHAAAAGTVQKAESNDLSGNFVLLDHGEGKETLYAHCSELYVQAGEQVQQGQVIARVGQTGMATGDHLHFEVRCGEEIYDPLQYISFD